jgi:hypothetical protein
MEEQGKAAPVPAAAAPVDSTRTTATGLAGKPIAQQLTK